MPAPLYTEDQKRQAVAVYVMDGTFERTAEITGIPAPTIKAWRQRNPDWFDRVAAEVWKDYGDESKSRCAEIIKLGFDRIKERLTKGDAVVDKDGNIVGYKPITGRDCAMITGTIFDKLRILEGKPTSISGKAEDTSKDRINELKRWAAGNVEAIKPA